MVNSTDIRCKNNEIVPCGIGDKYPYCDMFCPINAYALEQFSRTNKEIWKDPGEKEVNPPLHYS